MSCEAKHRRSRSPAMHRPSLTPALYLPTSSRTVPGQVLNSTCKLPPPNITSQLLPHRSAQRSRPHTQPIHSTDSRNMSNTVIERDSIHALREQIFGMGSPATQVFVYALMGTKQQTQPHSFRESSNNIPAIATPSPFDPLRFST